tara:strand:+ start:10041 stop:10526 length:486 start_codon:yes stop_codon:yes gene_type:complete
MYVNFNTLPQNSRIWIYQADREFTRVEVDLLQENTIAFIEEWTRHGATLKGSFALKYNRFLILAVDESFANASGCSIDASVRFVKQMETLFSIDLMSKLNVTYKEGQTIRLVNLSAFQEFANVQKITSETIVFNNMVQTKGDLESLWEVPAQKSWHRRFVS